jgi:uncharacterized protein YuzE
MRVTYDPEVDAMYIELRPLHPGEAENRDLGRGVIADFGSDGRLAGIEILGASSVLGESPEKIIVELAPAHRTASTHE